MFRRIIRAIWPTKPANSTWWLIRRHGSGNPYVCYDDLAEWVDLKEFGEPGDAPFYTADEALAVLLADQLNEKAPEGSSYSPKILFWEKGRS